MTDIDIDIDIEDLLRPERLLRGASGPRGRAEGAVKEEEEEEEEEEGDKNEAVEKLRADLLKWFDENRRLLPWRGDPANEYLGKSLATVPEPARVAPKEVDPYETWVSEVMLQQTRVETVIDFFTRWMERFPTPQALAQASGDEVNASWAGLGYYRRARNLHAGAQKVTEEFKGSLPSEVKDLLKVQGIGAYTAGAIASIAFGRAVPLVDGNVIRVFARLFAVGAEAKDPALVKGCWTLAGKLVDPHRPGDFNQALMELGATICKPRGADCAACPVRTHCRAHAQNPESVHEYPRKAKAKVLPVQTYAVGLVKRASRRPGQDQVAEFLVKRRPSTGLLAGQWEFVMARTEKASPSMTKRRDLVDAELASLNASIAPCKLCVANAKREDRGLYEHTFTHLQHRLLLEKVSLPGGSDCACVFASGADDHNDEAVVEHDVEIVDESSEPTSDAREVAWMTLAELETRGMTASTTKCLVLADEFEDKASKRKGKRKAAGSQGRAKDMKKQSRLTKFFGTA